MSSWSWAAITLPSQKGRSSDRYSFSRITFKSFALSALWLRKMSLFDFDSFLHAFWYALKSLTKISKSYWLRFFHQTLLAIYLGFLLRKRTFRPGNSFFKYWIKSSSSSSGVWLAWSMFLLRPLGPCVLNKLKRLISLKPITLVESFCVLPIKKLWLSSLVTSRYLLGLKCSKPNHGWDLVMPLFNLWSER